MFWGGQNECSPRVAALCAALAAIAILIAGAWHPTLAHADGGASARSQSATYAPDQIPATPQAYAQRILRALADRHTNNWVRYWQARADCDAAADYARRGDNQPLDRVLLTLTTAICARLDARLGVNPAAYPPRGDGQSGGLLLNEPGAAAGYTLFTLYADNRKIYLIDTLGRIAHIWRLEDNLHGKGIRHAKLLDNGNLLVLRRGSAFELDPRGNIVWQYDSEHELHHDFLKMPNGNVMMLFRGIKTREQAIAAGANPKLVSEHGLEYDYLLEARPTGASGGEVVWEWSVWDHLVQDYDPTKPNYGAIAKHPERIDINFLLEPAPKRLHDWTHANAIDYNPELDQIMLSSRHFSELWIIDHSATTAEARGGGGGNSGMGGDLLYRWGNPRAYDRGDTADQRLFWQHQTHWIPPGLPGAGNILVFNNGNEFRGKERSYSSADEIAPPADGYRYRRDEDAAYPPDALAWTYVAETPADFYAPFMSGAQRLPNGNTLIVDGTAGTIFQVTPDGKTMWKYIVPWHYHISLWQNAGPPRPTFGTPDNHPSDVIKKAVYRAYWYPPNHPGIQALDPAPGAYIENDPDPLDWARASIIAGDFGQPLAHSRYDIYLHENVLTYYKRPCADEDTRPRFFLNVTPARASDLPAHRQEHGFDNRDFEFVGRGKARAGWCIAIAPLPRYAVERIQTGQFTGEGQVWRADVELGE